MCNLSILPIIVHMNRGGILDGFINRQTYGGSKVVSQSHFFNLKILKRPNLVSYEAYLKPTTKGLDLVTT
jgi:hypothetical protein